MIKILDAIFEILTLALIGLVLIVSNLMICLLLVGAGVDQDWVFAVVSALLTTLKITPIVIELIIDIE